MTISGIVPNMVTPMTESGHPDVPGIERLGQFLVNSGVGGIWLLGSAGEDVHISQQDRIIVTKTLTNTVQNKVPVIVGLGTAPYYDIMNFVENVDCAHIAGYHFLPYDLKLGDKALVSYVRKIADNLPRPLWLYHNPKRGRPITLEIAKELSEHSNIAGIKVGGYNLTELTKMMMLKTPHFQVSGAGGGQLYQLLSLGAELHMTSDANCWPEVFIELKRLFDAGLRNDALALQHRIIGLSSRLPRNGNGEYAAEEKYILSLRGICEDWVNPAYNRLTDSEKNTTKSVLADFGFDWAKQP